MLRGGANTIGNLIVNHDDPILSWRGRWTNNGIGMQSGWLGSYVKFKVRNTATITTTHFIEISNTTASAYASFYIDGIPNRMAQTLLQGTGATYTGYKKCVFPIINDGNWHEIKIYSSAGGMSDQFNQTCKNTLVNFTMEPGAQITQSVIGTKVIQCIGDSWIGSAVNWTRRLDTASYDVHPIASNGISCANADTYYNFDFNGVTNSTDTNADAVVISYGVNDFNASITGVVFQASLLSLVDKVRAKQPTAKIFLLRVPSNIGASKAYGVYGLNMLAVAALRPNCYYMDSSGLDASITWDTDTAHLSANGVIDINSWVQTQLLANGI